MGQMLYLECSSGISGDMTVAALLDLGADWEKLQKVLQSLPVSGFQVAKNLVNKSGLSCMDFSVYLDAIHENRDHDMAYLHGEERGCPVQHDQAGHEHHSREACGKHIHEEHSQEAHVHHAHEHRGMKEITEVIEGAAMTPHAKEIALRIFHILAEAEAKAHGVPVEQVHFHEVGAVDSIVDIVSVAVCLDDLGIEQVIVPKLCEGTGSVRCQHGILPIPVPAVANILATYPIPLEILPVQGELVTPTGAAIVAAVATSYQLPFSFVIKKIGMGAGKRTYERPGILRAMLISDGKSEKCQGQQDRIYKLESNIDDCTGENLGFVMELLFEAGARDVHYFPVFMKKNRPAWQLNVLCSEEQIAKLEEIIFTHTTTIGIRRQCMERTILQREERQVETSLGLASVKICRMEGMVKIYPEYDSVSAICKRTGMPFSRVYEEIVRQTVVE